MFAKPSRGWLGNQREHIEKWLEIDNRYMGIYHGIRLVVWNMAGL
jgi:hypothetical protein